MKKMKMKNLTELKCLYTAQTCGVGIIFHGFKSLMLTTAAFIWSKINVEINRDATFFQDSLMKRTTSFVILVYMHLLSLLINLMHSYRIKVLISLKIYKINIFLTPNFWTCRKAQSVSHYCKIKPFDDTRPNHSGFWFLFCDNDWMIVHYNLIPLND